MTHGTGWLPDPPERNASDPVLDAPLGAAELPSSAASTNTLPMLVLDQGRDNSCVAQAVALCLWAGQHRAGHDPGELASRKLLWWLCRRELGTERHNTGCFLRLAFELAQSGGVARERHFPHETHYATAPRPYLANLSYDQRDNDREDIYEGGERERVLYRRIVAPKGRARIDAFKRAVVGGLVIAAGTDVPERFKRHEGGEFTPEPGEPMAGGHALVIHGYTPGRFLVRNSWGVDWGSRGSAWVDENWVGTWRDPWVVLAAPPFSDEVTK